MTNPLLPPSSEKILRATFGVGGGFFSSKQKEENNHTSIFGNPLASPIHG